MWYPPIKVSNNAETNVQLYCFILTKEHCTKMQYPLPPFTKDIPSLDTIFYAHMICGHPARGRRSQPMAAQRDLFRDLFRWFWNAIGHLHQSDQRDRSRETSRKDWAWDLYTGIIIITSRVNLQRISINIKTFYTQVIKVRVIKITTKFNIFARF